MEFLYEYMFIIIILFIIIIICFVSCVVQIKQSERGIKYSFGNFHSVMNPGFYFVIPIIYHYKKVDISPREFDILDLVVITSNNSTIKLNVIICYEIFDVAKAMLEVEDYHMALVHLSQITIRNISNSITRDEILNRKEKLSSSICDFLNKSVESWGIKVNKVELGEVNVIKR